MATVIKNLAAGTLSTSVGSGILVGTVNKGYLIKSIVLTNIDTVAHTANITVTGGVDPNNSSNPYQNNILPKDLTIPAGGRLAFDLEIALYWLIPVGGSPSPRGDKLQGAADTASKIDYVISGFEFDL